MVNGTSVRTPLPLRDPYRGELGEEATDRELLDRYAHHREDSAFTALVKRHGPYVLGVCRRVLLHEQEAEDVCQAAFLVLARKAGCIAWQESVRSWLCAVAYRLAVNAKAALARRHLQEKPIGTLDAAGDVDEEHGPVVTPVPSSRPAVLCHPQANPLAQAVGRELRSVLDDELDELPEKYRAPVVLCYLEGKTNVEAARVLGWPVGSMSRRLGRARALLCQRLKRRGLAFALVLLCLPFLALWALKRSPQGGPNRSPVQIAEVMKQFKQSGTEAPGIENTLRRVATSEQMPSRTDARQLLELARQAAALSELIQAHDPGHRQKDWARFTDEMRLSALTLAETVQKQDDRAILVAARTLHNRCQQCHEVFRP